MEVRKRHLPPGWYPESRIETESLLNEWQERFDVAPTHDAVSAIVPHAGWYFSGELSFRVLRRFEDVDVFVVFGGHLRPQDSIVAYSGDIAETPVGNIEVETGLRGDILKEFSGALDRTTDNTIEVHLPILKHLFKDSRYLGIRVPPSMLSVNIGEFVASWAEDSRKNVVCIGSTDLTHYGTAYGFEPSGRGEKARRWAEENDRLFIEDMCALRLEAALERADRNRCACSAGAAVASAAFAVENGVTAGTPIAYESSASKGNQTSFVGYGTVIYEKIE